MSLHEAIKEMKEQLVEEDKKEEAAAEEAVEEKVEEKVGEKKEEVKEEEKKEDVEEEKVEEEKPDQAAFQRLRRERAAANKKAEDEAAKRAELEAELAVLKAPIEEDKIVKQEIDPEIALMVQDNRLKRAEREFQSMENTFKLKTPEYEAVSTEYAMALMQSIKIQNPRISNVDLTEETKKSILLKAAKYMNEGFDPVEELYHEARDLGFTGKSLEKKEKEEKTEEEVKPDMKKLASNRAKSTGMTSSVGESKGQVTKQAAADYTNAEWARLPKEEKRRLLYG